MVQTGNVTWDLFLEGEIQAGSQRHFDITEDLTEFCKRYTQNIDLVSDTCARGGARLQSTATLLAYKPSEAVIILKIGPTCGIPSGFLEEGRSPTLTTLGGC